MKIGIYLGDIKKPNSYGELTFELSFVDELLKKTTAHEFIFYYFGKKNIFKNSDSVHFVRLNRCFCMLNRRLKKDKVNLAIFLSPYIKEHIEVPYFALIRDVAHRVLPYFPEFSFKNENKFLNFLSYASKIITGNQISKDDIKTLYNVIDENILTIPLPYPSWVEHVETSEVVLSKFNLSKNAYILYPAQFLTHKNHIRLLYTAQILKEQNINLKIVFTGLDRGNKNYILSKVEEFDLENDILFLDYVKNNELASLYKNAYAMCCPSLAGVDSISALEALYFRCPVLISNNSGYDLQLKGAALYFNPLDESDIVKKIEELNELAIKDELLAKGELLIKECSFSSFVISIIDAVDNFYHIRQCWSMDEEYKI